MAARGNALTLTSHVHSTIRGDILSGRLPPGAPLRLAVLSGQLEVSASVVREALTRLSEQGLVTAAPNQGFQVVRLSPEDLIDLTGLRITVECLALEKSIAAGDVQWEAQVVSAHHVLERTPLTAAGTPYATAEWITAHAAFHDALSAGAGSPRLVALVRSLRDSAEIYRQWAGQKGPKRDVAAEHRALMGLATARKAVEAQEVLSRHIQHTTDLLLGNYPDPAS